MPPPPTPPSQPPLAPFTLQQLWKSALPIAGAVIVVLAIHYAFTYLSLPWAFAVTLAALALIALFIYFTGARSLKYDPAYQAFSRDIDAMAALARSVAATRGLSCPDCGQDLHPAATHLVRIDDSANCPNPNCAAPFTIESARGYWGFDPRGQFTGPPRLELRHQPTLPSVNPGRQTHDWLHAIESDPALKQQIESTLNAQQSQSPPPQPPPPPHNLP